MQRDRAVALSRFLLLGPRPGSFRRRPRDLKPHEDVQTGLICQVKLFRLRESARPLNAVRVVTVEAAT